MSHACMNRWVDLPISFAKYLKMIEKTILNLGLIGSEYYHKIVKLIGPRLLVK